MVSCCKSHTEYALLPGLFFIFLPCRAGLLTHKLLGCLLQPALKLTGCTNKLPPVLAMAWKFLALLVAAEAYDYAAPVSGHGKTSIEPTKFGVRSIINNVWRK